MPFDTSQFAFWSRSQKVGAALFSMSLIASALAVGSVHPSVLCAVALGFASSSVLLWWEAAPSWPRRPATVLLIVALGLVGFTYLQALPLPARLVAALDPRSADLWARSLSPLREAGPAFHALSLDPIATRIEALRGTVYVLAFLAALRVAGRREGVEVLCAILVGACLVVGCVALLHPAFGAHKVFGVYQPENAVDERHISPLLNPNPLAAYLNVGLCIAFTASLAPRPRVPRPIAVAGVVVLLATELWVASRGGFVAMALSFAVILLALRSQTRAPGALPLRGALVALFLLAGVATLVLASSKDAWEELAVTDTSKLALQRQMLPLVWAHPWLGVGRGAFESAYPSVRAGTGHVLFTHPEHVIVQWAAEWGIPLSLLALSGIAWALRPRVVIARSHLVIGPWAALCGAFVHNLVDLNSEVPAVMLLFVTCAALVVAGTGTPSTRVDRWSLAPRGVAISAGALAAVGLASVLPALGHDLYSDRRRVQDAALGDDDAFAAAVREAISRHPSEPYLPFAAALRASRRGSLDAIPWAARTVECAPVYGPVHMILARTLRQYNVAQARLEYRLAMDQAPELIAYVAREATSTIATYDDALELLPEHHPDAAIAALSPAVGARLPSTRALLDEELTRRDPHNGEALLRIARARVNEIEMGEPWCEAGAGASACLDNALASTKAIVQLTPTKCEGYSLGARAVAGAGQPDRATDQLSAAIGGLDDPARCLATLVKLTLEYGLDARLKDSVDRLARAPCASTEECTSNLVSAGEAEAHRGHLERALTFFRKAYERTPDNDAVLERLAATTSRIGLHAEASDAYDRLSRRHPDEPRYRERADQERAALGIVPPRRR